MDNDILHKFLNSRDNQHNSLTFQLHAAGYILQFIFCLIGNGLELYILPKIKSYNDYIKIALYALACSDLLQGFTSMPINFIVLNYQSWFLGRFLCKFMHFLLHANRNTGTWIIVYITLDRYITICHQKRFSSLKNRQFCVTVLVGMFFTHLTIFAYFLYSVDLHYSKKSHAYECYFSVSQMAHYLHIILTNIIYFYSIPIIFLVFFYHFILKTMLNSLNNNSFITFLKVSNDNNNETAADDNNSLTIINNDQTIVKVLLFYIIFFIILNFPNFIYGIASLIYYYDANFPMGLHILAHIAIFMSTMTTCVNPWMYCFYSKQYRNEVKKMFFHNRQNWLLLSNKSELYENVADD